jgi:meso-butanediol dehydrogenase/(S,S)-butanediol dehydrogenase/diacetyl reductase
MGRLSDKTAIVTGGASGIGAGIVRLFAAEGARVFIADVQEPAAMALADELGGNVEFVWTDVTAPEQVEALVARAAAVNGLHAMINNAGILRDGTRIAEAPIDAFDQTIAVDLKGVWLGIKYAVPALLASGGGAIVNVSSIAGIAGLNAQSAYGAAKGGVVQLTRHIAREYAADGIRSNCLCPGGIVTPLSFSRRPTMTEEEVKAQFATRNPSHRAGRPEDIAYAALWLASDEAVFVNGQVIAIDGGATSTIYWS